MPAAKVVMIGDRFGRWTVVGYAPSHTYPCGTTQRKILCRCDCGTERVVNLATARSGDSTSCGCLMREHVRARTHQHGRSRTPFYFCWLNMKARSSGQRIGYENVGRDPRWDSFENFRDDMWASYFPHAVLARYGDRGDYEPSNCRWLTRAENRAEQSN